MTEPYLIVIPHCSEEAEADELQMAIAGWRQHFKEPYKIVVLGENMPNIEADDVIMIESHRAEGRKGMYRPHLDFVKKFRKVHDIYPNSKGFIFAADDLFLLKDCKYRDVSVIRARNMKLKASPWENGWKRDAFRTIMLLAEKDIECIDYSSHLPVWFEWDKLLEMFDKYDMDNNSYILETLYYSFYYNDVQPMIAKPEDNVVSYVTADNTQIMKAQVDKGINDCKWLQNVAGKYTAYLSMRLREHYGL